jgi:NAD(P)H-dependent FMN reductase
LRAATAFLPEHIRVDHYDALANLPAFDPGLDLTPGPAVEDLRRRVKAASAILVATPEYAHGVPGSLKNALDWMVGSGELIDKPVAVIVASASDGAFALGGLVEVLRTMSAKVPDELKLSVAGIRSKLGPDGGMDAGLQGQIQALVQALLGNLQA